MRELGHTTRQRLLYLV